MPAPQLSCQRLRLGVVVAEGLVLGQILGLLLPSEILGFRSNSGIAHWSRKGSHRLKPSRRACGAAGMSCNVVRAAALPTADIVWFAGYMPTSTTTARCEQSPCSLAFYKELGVSS